MQNTKILFLAANPIKKNILGLDNEFREIDLKIRQADLRDSIDLISAWSVRPEDLLERLDRHRPHIVHFSGHGNQEGQILLADHAGNPAPVDAGTLESLFTTMKDNIQLVVLNACFSTIQAAAITKVIDCVIGMRDLVNDNTAIAFAAALYRAIGFGRSIQEAFDQARVEIKLELLPGPDTPRLVARDGVDPRQLVFVRTSTSKPANQPDEIAESAKGLSQALAPSAVPMAGSPGQAAPGGSRSVAAIDEKPLLTYASTFLSYSSVDSPLVEAVSRELGRRGILAWLDKDEVYAGLSLGDALSAAIKEQATVTVFLSLEALNSGWVDHELRLALEKEDELNATGVVLPVFLDDPEVLVRAHPLLRTRWINQATNRVDRRGILAGSGKDVVEQATRVASQVATSIYRRLSVEKSDDVVVYLDQRGEGERRRKPDMPEHLLGRRAPALVFRQDSGRRTYTETLHGAAWDDYALTMSTALADALPHLTSQRLRRIHLAGHAQLGFAYLIGDRFDRATNTELHCTGRFGDVFTNKGQSLFAPVDGGNPHCETVRPPEVPPLPDRNEIPSISLLLCREKEGEKYLSDITDHIALKHPDAHPVWVKHPLPVKPDEIMPYINDVVALLSRLYREKRVRTVHLYTSLPFHAVPLLAARLKKYVVDSVAFMEYRSDLQGTNPTAGELYSHLRMRGESLG